MDASRPGRKAIGTQQGWDLYRHDLENGIQQSKQQGAEDTGPTVGSSWKETG